MGKKWIKSLLIIVCFLGICNFSFTEAFADTWVWPVPSVSIGSNISTYFSSSHTGIDIYSSLGTPIVAARSGTVERAFSGDIPNTYYGGGNTVVIKHGPNLFSHYAHLNSYIVSAGQSVTEGQVIGYMGSTGNSTGVHLHFAIKSNSYGGDNGAINNNPGSVTYVNAGSSNQLPVGSIDSIYGTSTGTLHISGWAFDWDRVSANDVGLDIALNPGASNETWIPRVHANGVYRPDVENAYPGAGNYHGFDLECDVTQRGTFDYNVFAIGDKHVSGSGGYWDATRIGEGTITISADYANTISLNKTQLNLDSGNSETLSVNYFPSDTVNKKVWWSSSNTEVAMVSNGVITAKAPGKAVITANAYGNDNATATCTVTVTGIPVSSLKFINNFIEIPIGYEVDGTIYTEEVDVQAKIDPSNASTKKVIWFPEYDKLYKDGNWWRKPTAELLNADGCQELWQPDGNIFICPDDSYVLKIQGGIYPKAKIGETKQFKISTSKDFDDYSDILTVRLVSAIKSIVITNSSDIDITEQTVSVARGSSLQLSAAAEPFYNPQTFTWMSSDTSIATVDSTGNVTYIGPGTVIITATSTDGGGKYEWVKLTEEPVSTCKKPGDFTGDGEITGKDLMRLQRYLIDKSTPMSCSGDVTGDGEITGKDLMRLQRYLVDKTTVLH